MSRLIELAGYATVEVAPIDDIDGPRLIISNERCKSVSLTMESARLLFHALGLFDQEGLLG